MTVKCLCCKTNKIGLRSGCYCDHCRSYIKKLEKTRLKNKIPKYYIHENGCLRLYVYPKTLDFVFNYWKDNNIKTPNGKFNFPFLLNKLLTPDNRQSDENDIKKSER